MTTEERANEKSRRLLFHMLVQKTNRYDMKSLIQRSYIDGKLKISVEINIIENISNYLC